MKKYFFITFLPFLFLTDIAFANMLNANEEYICENVKTESCIKLCKLKMEGNFIEARDAGLSMNCAIDFNQFSLSQKRN